MACQWDSIACRPQSRRDKVSEGFSEVTFFGTPVAYGTDMFMTNNARQTAIVEDPGVEYRSDSQWLTLAGEEFCSPWQRLDDLNRQ